MRLITSNNLILEKNCQVMPKNADPIKIAGIIFLLSGIGLTFFRIYPRDFYLSSFIHDFYANFSAEFISIAITILLIDYMHEVKEKRSLKARLIRDLSNEQKGISSRALYELKDNGWLADGTLANADLQYANLSNLDLSGANLHSADLSFANLTNATLKNTNLNNAILSHAKFTNANLENCQINDARLHRTNFGEAILNKVNATNADFMNAQMELTEMTDAVLTNCKFDDVNFKLSNLSRSTFIDSMFLRADVESVNIKGAAFERCDIQGLRNWENLINRNPSSFSSPRNEPNDFLIITI